MISNERRAAALTAANQEDRSTKISKVLRLTLEWLRSVSIALAIFFVARVFVIEAFKIPSGSMERTLMIGDFLLVNKIGYAADIPFSNARIPASRIPRLGEVVVFQWPADRSKNFVKRVVGVPGDTLEMHNGNLYRNGTQQRESYALHQPSAGDLTADDFNWQLKYLARAAKPVISKGNERTSKSTPFTKEDGGEVSTVPQQELSLYHPSRNNWGPIVIPPHNYFVLGDNRDNSLDSRYWGFVPDSLVRGRPLLVYYSYDPKLQGVREWLSRVRWHRFGETIK